MEDNYRISVYHSGRGEWEAQSYDFFGCSTSGETPELAVQKLRSLIEEKRRNGELRSTDSEKQNKSTLYCSFCGKSQFEVRKLIAGPTVFICDGCTELCDDIIIEESFPDRIVIRVRAPSASIFDDTLFEVIRESISEKFPDIDLRYEMRHFDSLEEAREGTAFAIYSFAKIYGEPSKNSVLSKQYNEIASELKTALSQLTVLNKKFVSESERASAVEAELATLKAEYLDYIREHTRKSKEISTLRAVMFLDIVGFSMFGRDHQRKVVDMLRGIIPPLMDKKGAQDINMWGDAIVANFTDPNSAIECAVKFIRHLSVEKLDARIGMAWGNIRVTYNAATGRPDVDGPIVDFAARIEAMAPVGGILLSKEFGGLEINPAIGELIETSLPVKKSFGDYEAGDLIDLYHLKVNMN